MTNHPRRLGRRKLQRRAGRAFRGVDLTRMVRSVRFGAGPEVVPDRLVFYPAGRTGRAG